MRGIVSERGFARMRGAVRGGLVRGGVNFTQTHILAGMAC
jgi:hypothetical protein